MNLAGKWCNKICTKQIRFYLEIITYLLWLHQHNKSNNHDNYLNINSRFYIILLIKLQGFLFVSLLKSLSEPIEFSFLGKVNKVLRRFMQIYINNLVLLWFQATLSWTWIHNSKMLGAQPIVWYKRDMPIKSIFGYFTCKKN